MSCEDHSKNVCLYPKIAGKNLRDLTKGNITIFAFEKWHIVCYVYKQ